MYNIINKLKKYLYAKRFLNNVTCAGTKYDIWPHSKALTIFGSTKNDITIDDDFTINSGQIVSCNGGKIHIGSLTKFGFNTKVFCVKSISIGHGTRLGDNVTIVDNNNHSVNPNDRKIMAQTPRGSKYRSWIYSDNAPISIGEWVWIGTNARICKGVTIGNGAVIAANTIVTKDVPANSICAGNPGRIVKTNIDQLPRLIPDEALNIE